MPAGEETAAGEESGASSAGERPERAEMVRRLEQHLRTWLGAWPATAPVTVATSPLRDHAGWDGAVHPIAGVRGPAGLVLSVPGRALAEARAAGPDLDGIVRAVGRVLDMTEPTLYDGVFRWSAAPATEEELPDAGQWIEVEDRRVPEWLRPFNGGVLMALEEDRYVGGVGIKRHDEIGQELAVVTEEGHREKGLARRLVAQAARYVIARGGVPTYLHADSNEASAHVADAAGFPDEGWRITGLVDRARQPAPG